MKVYRGQHPKGSKEQVFNYRIRRSRRGVENVFGLASSVFRVLLKPMLLEPDKAQLVVMTVACLHHFLRRSHDWAQFILRQARLIMKKMVELLKAAGEP
jgi:hypothetical protein